MKGVLLTYAPTATLVDISHEVSPGDVRAAQYILSRAWMLFPEARCTLLLLMLVWEQTGECLGRRDLGGTFWHRITGAGFFLVP